MEKGGSFIKAEKENKIKVESALITCQNQQCPEQNS